MQTIISIAQIVISVLLMILILLQERDSDMSGFLSGGSAGGGFYQQRRGLEKVMFYATIILVFVFAGLALASLFV
jgi:protein translocase SecG subunit